QDGWTRTAGPGRLDQDGWTRTAGPGRLDQDGWTRTAGPGRLDQDGWTRTAGPGRPDQDGRTRTADRVGGGVGAGLGGRVGCRVPFVGPTFSPGPEAPGPHRHPGLPPRWLGATRPVPELTAHGHHTARHAHPAPRQLSIG